jgi:exopolysaccharide biosynthesis WecB/TagA/CpsF family protein
MPWPRIVVGNVAIDLVNRESAMSLILAPLSGAAPLAVASANLDHIHHFAHDKSWERRHPATGDSAESLRWLTLLDGVPLVRKANSLTGCDWPKLSGSDLIYPILDSAAGCGARVGFVGGSAETQARLVEVVRQRLPAIRIVGTWAPDRSELMDRAASERITAEINDARVDVLVVGLGKPLQENWINRHGSQTGAKVLLAFGAVVDFLAGRVRRAPEPVAEAGAEWAWRLMLEPRRLGRRYLIQGPPALLRLNRRAKVVEAALATPPQQQSRAGEFASEGDRADVTAIVVTYNSESDIPSLIDDLRTAACRHSIRLVVVDNQSRDRTVEVVRSHPGVILIESGGNLGYSGGINAGLPFVGQSGTVLILNPDLRLDPNSITHMLAALDGDRIGAVVPRMLDEDGETFISLRREPSVGRAIGDSLLGTKLRARPAFSSEVDSRLQRYLAARDVDWATGAAILMPAAVVRELGDWSEEYFLYSEETEYLRRIRDSGRRVRFEPSAVVRHRRGGSGTSPALAALMAVNRVRYVERHHGGLYSTLFRGAVAFGHALRSWDAVHRHTLAFVMNRERWHDLPRATKPILAPHLSGSRGRGAVIVPAYNEEAVIERTLTPLSQAAVDGFYELIVVCNGCVDRTADVARAVPGVRVIELTQGSKPAALNAGDAAATLWPRLYLDADIQLSAAAVLDVLERLGEGDILAARPESRYDSSDANALVRSYYRARARIQQHKLAMWGAGAYALSAEGHRRLGSFPTVTGDDLLVDTLFEATEKAVVATDPSVVKTPLDTRSLLAILRRNYKGGNELRDDDRGGDARIKLTGLDTVVAVVRTVRGPRSVFDAAVYLVMALAARFGHRAGQRWERDESSRLAS